MENDKQFLDPNAENERSQGVPRALNHLSSTQNDVVHDSAVSSWRQDLVLRNSPDSMAAFGLRGELLDANQAFCDMLGYCIEELQHLNLSDIEAKEDPEEIATHLKLIRETGGDRFETKLRRKDGLIIDVAVSSNICELNGRQYYLEFHHDITLRKQAEQDLRESEEKYRNLVEMFPHAIAIFQDGKTIFANQTALRFLGRRDISEILGKDSMGPIPEHEKARLRDYLNRRLSGDQTVPTSYRVDMIRSDGSMFPVEVYANQITYHGRPASQIMAINISDQIEAENAIKESESRYRNLVEQINAVTYSAKPDQFSSNLYISPQIESLIGYSSAEMVSDPKLWFNRIHPDDAEHVSKKMSESYSSGEPLSLEYRMIARDGKIVWFKDDAIIKCDEAGRPEIVHGVMIDITRQKEIETTLAASEKRYQDLFNSALEGIAVLDKDVKVQFCNPAFAGILDLESPAEIIGKCILGFQAEKPERTFLERPNMWEAILPSQHELEIISARGNRKTLLVSSSPLFDAEGRIDRALSSVIDITERKELEKIYRTLARISEASSAGGSLPEMIHKIRNALAYLIDVTNFYVALWDETDDSYTCPYHADTDGSDLSGRLSLKNTLTDYVRRSGLPLLADAKVQRRLKDSGDFNISHVPPVVWLGVPLKIFDRVTGVVAIQLYQGSGTYTEKDLRFLEMVSGHISTAIERKRAEEALRKSEEFNRAIIDYSPLAVSVRSRTGKLLSYNKAWQKVWNKSDEEIEKLLASEKTELTFQKGDDYLRQWHSQIRDIYNRGGYLHIPEAKLLYTSGNGERWVSQYFYAIQDDKGTVEKVVILTEDISERKRTDKALRESEERHRAIWENSPVGICLTDRDGIYHYVNKTYCSIYGYTPEELIGRPFYELIAPPEKSRAYKESHFRKFGVALNSRLGEAEVFVRKDGSPVAIQFTSDYVMVDGQAKFEVAMNIDVTEKRRAEEALRESQERYRLLVENAGEIIVNVDKDGNFLLANWAASRFFNKSPGDFIGKSLGDFFPPEIAMNYLASVKHVADTCESMNIERMIIFKGERLWFKANLQPITHGNGQVTSVLIITRDTTVQKVRELRDQARLNLLQRLRLGRDVDDCLRLGCLAIFEAELFKRAVLTLHNEERLIINLGQYGIDEDKVDSARKGSAPELEIVKKMMAESQHISHSYFVPLESGLARKDWERRVAQVELSGDGPGTWVDGDELFVPVVGNNNNNEGWLSVDTPFDGKRPSKDTVEYLEEIVAITTKQVHEIQSLELMQKESKALQQKQIVLDEVLAHIDDKIMQSRQRMSNNVTLILIPALKNLINKKDGTVNKTYYSILSAGLPELVSGSGGVSQLFALLSPREREIALMIKSDSTSGEIAGALHIALPTVQKHRESIRRKLGINNKDINLANFLKDMASGRFNENNGQKL